MNDSDLPVYDVIYPSSNAWGIPDLDPGIQAPVHLPPPVTKWGTIARSASMPGTYHFYTDDYKFEALWNDPAPLVCSGCQAVIEPNFSTGPETPRALVLWNTYRKRWLARWWQEHDLPVIVDVNIEREFFDIMLLGVPESFRHS